uniref:Reverse transcriptase Ty1/copia-type domain-containing protein n=1 Tax=Lactuca sativa TaxID=4236 RepID=A0A9R1VT29_LACSA|nr:hypothetical protein LSAT_V11C400179810 [Lactuca sativa]
MFILNILSMYASYKKLFMVSNKYLVFILSFCCLHLIHWFLISLFTFHSGKETIYLLVYADEIILTAYDPSLITRFISHLSAEFFIMYLRPLSLFPRISATQSPH